MARPKKIDSDEIIESVAEVKRLPEFKITRVYDPTSTLPREIDAYSQDELDRLLAGGWALLTE
jgi:hypothetical protein